MFQAIPVVNRAQLIDDAFSIGRFDNFTSF